MRLAVGFVALLCCVNLFAQELPLYYGADFLKGYQDKSLTNDALKTALFNILSGGHLKSPNTPDILVASCAGTTQIQDVDGATKKCEQHTALGYDPARKKLFGQLYLKQTADGQYSVTDVYCEHTFTDLDFKGAKTFGPDLVPISGNLINTEHTWPQSRFTNRFNNDLQKSDLHHLYPADSQANAQRSSLHFGNVVKLAEPSKCSQDKLGQQADDTIVFEVPDSQKGRTARAIFYFATRYQMKIAATEEAALRDWNKRFPVDAAEFERNNAIEALQGNRNPYIDFADLLDRVDHF
ncbi:MAG: endonuclease I family protein [Pseudobdellovibrio sp.]